MEAPEARKRRVYGASVAVETILERLVAML
jgi:hypothetical protein